MHISVSKSNAHLLPTEDKRKRSKVKPLYYGVYLKYIEPDNMRTFVSQRLNISCRMLKIIT